MLKKITLLFSLVLMSVQLCLAQNNAEVKNQLPKPLREFRAAWIATVANINWPSKPGLTTTEQQKEAIVLLDLLKSLNFNAAILQIRPQADALYKSDLEPWSYFLTGKQGKAPEPYYDPLQFWVEAAHDRGLELHVWLNPYRAHHLSGGEESAASVVKSKPELVVKLKDGQYWMDPSKKEVQDHSAAVVKDIVKRYDIDGVHIDDYFYPYESYNGGADFPDQQSWDAYQKAGGKLSRGDWRRQSVNTFIKRIYKEIKAEKKYVKFGISPFGIWRPGFPEGVEGLDQYDKLYADAKLWLNKGWLDYFSPQLYWTVNAQKLSFPVLLGWWQSENTKGRHLWPGMNIGLGGDDKNVDEVVNQIMISRGMLPTSKGALHWSIDGLVKHEKLRKGLIDGPYQKEAIVPASKWLDKKAPKMPIASSSQKDTMVQIKWDHPEKDDVFKWVVYYKYGGKWNYRIMTRNDNSLDVSASIRKTATSNEKLTAFGVTAIDRSGNESEFHEYTIGQKL
ncbi:glycoside hydrolase family 10 protein [Pedobacter boryungensis]|uniref:Family 10 glycosylhydrolase n=1 Tax=Pedobacter boryungensis TaxID=869962 RepID=A0ABX2DEW2_9SPHI|nr:family 10 glycosylhydrolase [Pedobacter boryungensis]NQX32624.1 family 10 glycosylhydrolase [Pedobacter boryungensis]